MGETGLGHILKCLGLIPGSELISDNAWGTICAFRDQILLGHMQSKHYKCMYSLYYLTGSKHMYFEMNLIY